eukprot:Clim_evm46s227 gene=Clim_evmTU46s227
MSSKAISTTAVFLKTFSTATPSAGAAAGQKSGSLPLGNSGTFKQAAHKSASFALVSLKGVVPTPSARSIVTKAVVDSKGFTLSPPSVLRGIFSELWTSLRGSEGQATGGPVGWRHLNLFRGQQRGISSKSNSGGSRAANGNNGQVSERLRVRKNCNSGGASSIKQRTLHTQATAANNNAALSTAPKSFMRRVGYLFASGKQPSSTPSVTNNGLTTAIKALTGITPHQSRAYSTEQKPPESTDGGHNSQELGQASMDPKIRIVFTCKVCNTRQGHEMSRHSYEKGVVIIQCDGCQNRHLIADHLGWFKDLGEGITIESLLQSKGEEVKKLGNLDLLDIPSGDREHLLLTKED